MTCSCISDGFLAISGAMTTAVDMSRPAQVRDGLTGDDRGGTLGEATEQFHRLRGGVKVPTGGRLSLRSQPANPVRPDATE